jgi:hypothetical protein
MYPEKYGNAWDSSLKILPYFPIKKTMDEYIKKEHISPDSIGTQFPLIADEQFSELSDQTYHCTNIWKGPVEHFPYILLSNVINTDIPEQFDRVRKNWIIKKELKSGLVNITLYQRPLK